MSYNVTLVDLAGVTDAKRKGLEKTFRTVLEKLLGGPEGVAEAWRACEAQRAANSASTLTVNEVTLGGPISRWDLMHAMASRQALEGWKGLVGDARFEITA